MRRILLLVAATAVVVGLTAAVIVSSSGRSDAGDGGVPDLVGTWTGPYEYPIGTDEVVSATETLVIETQKGRLIWGNDEYVEQGQTIQIPVRGSIDREGEEVMLAEENGFFFGEILGANRMRVRFVRTDDQFTTFEAVLRRS